MDNAFYEHIEEFGTNNSLWFYFVKRNGLWGILDIDHEEIIPCRYDVKPELSFFQELFSSEPDEEMKLTKFYPEYYAYKLFFKVTDYKNKFGLYIIEKQLLPDPAVYRNFTKHIFDDISVDTNTKEIHVVENNKNKTYTFNYFEEHKMD